jgi:glutamine amidotransferase-like uncharacterized protein
MTTITLKIKNHTKAGKIFMSIADSYIDANVVEIVELKNKSKLPNKVTLKTFENTDNGINLTHTNSHQDLMEKLFS